MNGRKTKHNSDDEEYNPNCEQKRPYKFVTPKVISYSNLKKRQKLIQLAVQNQVKVNRACKKAGVNNSNAKVIIRQQKARRNFNNPSSTKEEVKIQVAQESQKEVQIQVKKEEEVDWQQNQPLCWFPLGFPWFYTPFGSGI